MFVFEKIMMAAFLQDQHSHVNFGWQQERIKRLMKKQCCQESVVWLLQNRPHAENVESIACAVMHSNWSRQETMNVNLFSILIPAIVEWVKSSRVYLNHFYLGKNPVPLVPGVIPFLSPDDVYGKQCISDSLLEKYLVSRDASSFSILIQAMIVTEKSFLVSDAFKVCCEKNWYEGARICYDAFLPARSLFNEFLFFHVWRFPRDNQSELFGFFVDYPQIFKTNPSWESSEKAEKTFQIQYDVYQLLYKKHKSIPILCPIWEDTFEIISKCSIFPLSVPVLHALVVPAIHISTHMWMETICRKDDMGISLWKKIVLYGDAVVAKSIYDGCKGVRNAWYHMSSSHMLDVLLAIPSSATSLYPFLLFIASNASVEMQATSICYGRTVLKRDVAFVAFLLEFIKKRDGISKMHQYLMDTLQEDHYELIRELDNNTLLLIQKELGQTSMEELANELHFSIRQLCLLFGKDALEQRCKQVVLSHNDMLEWVVKNNTVEELALLPPSIVKDMFSNADMDDIEILFTEWIFEHALDGQVFFWITLHLKANQMEWVRNNQEEILDAFSFAGMGLYDQMMYLQWFLLIWPDFSYNSAMLNFSNDIFSISCIMQSSRHVELYCSLLTHPVIWSCILRTRARGSEANFVSVLLFQHLCREETAAHASMFYFYFVWCFLYHRTSTADLLRFHHLARLPFVVPLLTQPLLYHHSMRQAVTLFHYMVLDRSDTQSSILLTIPSIRREAIEHQFYRSSRAAQYASDIDTSRESSMHALSPQERSMVEKTESAYGDIVRARGVETLIDEFRQVMKTRYEREPAMDHATPLPFDGPTRHRSYYTNVWHTAARFLMKPNPWIHPHASFVQHDDDKSWASMESTKFRYLFALYWVAATDVHAPCATGYTPASNVECFAKCIAYINRAHNWDQITRFRKLPNGKTVEEEVDDEEADRPSCSMGMERRLYTSVPGNLHTHYVDTEERVREWICDCLRSKIRALSPEVLTALVNVIEQFLVDQYLEPEQIFILLQYNVQDEEHDACLAQFHLASSPLFDTTEETMHSHILQYIHTYCIELIGK